jgi:hypothetical protein
MLGLLALRRAATGDAAARAARRLVLRPASFQASGAAEPEPEPLSFALEKLEATVLDAALPAEARRGNAAALETLRDFCAGLAGAAAGRPPAAIRTLEFVLPPRRVGAAVRRVRSTLKTTGGDCRRLVEASLGELFAGCGVAGRFAFDGGEFAPSADRPPPTPAAVEATRARAAAAGFPSQAISEAEFTQLQADQAAARGEGAAAEASVEAFAADLARLDPLLAAAAAVPWLEAAGDAEGARRAALIRADAVDSLEAWGWGVRAPLARLWAGARAEAEVVGDAVGGARAAAQALLLHARRLDAAHGKEVVC